MCPADKAYGELKLRFMSAPTLAFRDPSRQFVVEVDTSDSQRSVEDQKLHPCAFFSRKLLSAERNYDIGNR